MGEATLPLAAGVPEEEEEEDPMLLIELPRSLGGATKVVSSPKSKEEPREVAGS
jgi:hypothetical protein